MYYFLDDEDRSKEGPAGPPKDPGISCPRCGGPLSYLRMHDFCVKCNQLVFYEDGIARLRDP